MRNFQDTFVKRKRSFISAFWICMAVYLTILYCIYMQVQICICICVYVCIKGTMFYIIYIHRERQTDRQKTLFTIGPYVSLQSLCPLFFIKILFFHQMIAPQKLWKMFFISSKKLFSFSRYSNFYNFSPSFPHFSRFKRTYGSGIIYDVINWLA